MPCDFSSSGSWVILSPIERGIKEKIEKAGTPLKDWDIQINYGIKTGCNEAFIIPTGKRDEILSHCASDDERKRTEELIRPILRGKDIKRYGYDWKGRWLINTHNGVKGKFPRIKIEDYPAVKAHLDQYRDKIYKRADQGDTPYNLRNCAYLEDFSKPKIMYMEIQTDNPQEGYPFPCFSYDEKDVVVLNTAYIICSNAIDIRYLLGVLNSSLGAVLSKFYVTQLQRRQFRMLAQYVRNFPIPQADSNQQAALVSLVRNEIQYPSKENETRINNFVYSLYGLSLEEIRYIEGKASEV